MTINTDPSSIAMTVCEMIARACNFERAAISPNDSMYDLGLDSMSATSLLSELEALYEVEFGPDKIVEILQVQFVGELIVLVTEVVQGEALALADA
jgi:acyl carrier protein